MGLMGTFSHIRISAVAAAVPERCLTNEDFSGVMDAESIQKFEKMTGVRERHHSDTLATSDLALAAAQALKTQGAWSPETIDGLLFVTQFPDAVCPATACVLHGLLGLTPSCAALDVSLGCSGFVYGLYIASSMLCSMRKGRFLVLGGDTLHKAIATDDVSNKMLFGDAGFATVVEYDEAQGQIFPWLIGTDGRGAFAICLKGDSSWQTLTHIPQTNQLKTTLQMDGLEVFNFTINTIPSELKAFCANYGKEISSYDHYCFHQANRFILKQVATLAGFPNRKHLISIDRFGNTSSASIPLTLCDHREHLSGHGGTLMAGFGVGLSWGIAAYDFSQTQCLPVVFVKEKAYV